ncbi:MAG: transglycosylase SLT domain-containing protein [Deltaproteobacteria bacterium]|nr:transglycosylase SLT domain-containing protein [Deltaproteobacteria bacterium]
MIFVLLILAVPIASGRLVSRRAELVELVGKAIYPYYRGPDLALGTEDVSRMEEYMRWGRRLKELNPALTAQEVFESGRAIVRYSGAYKLPPSLVVAIIKVESHGNVRAVSRRGARGLMQVMPWWPSALGMEGDLFSIDTNIRIGTHILAENIKRWGKKEGIQRYYRGNLPVSGERYYVKVQQALLEVPG